MALIKKFGKVGRKSRESPGSQEEPRTRFLNFMICSHDYVHADVATISKYLTKTRDGIVAFKAAPLRRHSCRHADVHAEVTQDQKNERGEEGPITITPLKTVKRLEQAARRLAKSVNYVGVATVEYLYSMETGGGDN